MWDVGVTSRIASSQSSISSRWKRIGSIDQIVSKETSIDSSAANRCEDSFASASIAASFAASRWRWSSNCSAVSTTDVTMPGLQTTPPDVQTAPPRPLRDVPQLERELRGAGKRIAPRVDRRRAGVRLALPRDEVSLHAERAQHDAERQIERLEHRALLDVQLEVGGCVLELALRLARAVEVDAMLCERVRQRHAVGVPALAQLVLIAHRPGRGARAEASGRSARPPRRPS